MQYPYNSYIIIIRSLKGIIMPQHNVNVTDHHKSFVESLIDVQFTNISEVYRAALNLLEKAMLEKQMNEQELFHRELDKGVNAYFQGDFVRHESPEAFLADSAERRKQWDKELEAENN